MKVLVTGASGFIGGNLARLLWERGHEVRALVRPSTAHPAGGRAASPLTVPLTIRDTGVTPVSGDILDRPSLDRAVQGCEAVFHCAAAYTFWSADPGTVRRTNVEGTVNVLTSARQAGVSRVVYTSTVSTVGLPKGGVGDETTPLDPQGLYGHYKESKYEAEQAALNLASEGLPVVVVNPTSAIGPWDVKPTPTGRMVLDFLRRKIPAYLGTGTNVVDVADVAAGHLLALERGRTGERYILGNKNMALKDVFNTLAEVTGLPAPRIRLPYWLIVGAGYVDRAVEGALLRRQPAIPLEGILASKKPAYVSCEKAVRELGLPQSPVEGAFKKAVDWFTEHGYAGSNQDWPGQDQPGQDQPSQDQLEAA